MASVREAFQAARSLHDEAMVDPFMRQKHIVDLTAYLTAGDAILSSPKIPQIMSKVIDLFADESLTEIEQRELAMILTMPLLDKGLGHQLDKASAIDTADYPDDRQDFIHNLQDTLYCIERASGKMFAKYVGSHVIVRSDRIVIQD